MLVALVGLAFALNLNLDQLAARWGEIGGGVLWALLSGVSMVIVYYLNANALKPIDNRVRTFVMTAVTAIVMGIAGAATDRHALPHDAVGWTGLALLTGFYCIAMISLFFVIPRVPATSTAALNFEPIAALVLGFIFLGHVVTPLQLLGAFVTVGSIAWLGVSKK
jgi:drug/metabolite transporter (DMT)-like permease